MKRKSSNLRSTSGPIFLNAKEKTEWSIVPIIQTPERIQLKYRLNISQQSLYIIHVMSGDEVTH
jgi:hypothetical protein